MVARRKNKKPVIFTIGHSTRSLDDFIALLRGNGVKRVIDIRTIPQSRHNPQYNRESLPASLRAAQLSYTHLKKLGGLRRAKADSKNLGWRNASFRGFADYMQTAEFEAGLNRALKLANAQSCVLMCAEAVPWRCHRSLIADALVARRFPVQHIISGSRPQFHRLTPFARVRAGHVIYPTNSPP